MAALEQTDNATPAASDAATALSEKLVRKLDVLIEEAFDLARSEEDLDLLNKTINAFANVRGKLAPPPKTENNWPTLNFAFVNMPGQVVAQPVQHARKAEPVQVEVVEDEPLPAPTAASIDLVPVRSS